MPPAPRYRDPVVEADFISFAHHYRERAAELDREVEALRDERDEWIRRAHAGGLSHDDIAELVGLTRQRVSRIIRPR